MRARVRRTRSTTRPALRLLPSASQSKTSSGGAAIVRSTVSDTIGFSALIGPFILRSSANRTQLRPPRLGRGQVMRGSLGRCLVTEAGHA